MVGEVLRCNDGLAAKERKCEALLCIQKSESYAVVAPATLCRALGLPLNCFKGIGHPTAKVCNEGCYWSFGSPKVVVVG